MHEHNPTAEKLRQAAKNRFWRYGYVNVSVRQIAKDVGVDVALIHRYFRNKRGLFEATLSDAKFPDFPQSEAGLIEFFVDYYSQRPDDAPVVTPFNLLLSCAQDEEVGARIRELYEEEIQKKLVEILESEKRAALFSVGILGFALAEKSLMLSGMPRYDQAEYRTTFKACLQNLLA